MPTEVKEVYTETVYECNICKRRYYSVEQAAQCEQKHELLKNVKIGQFIMWKGKRLTQPNSDGIIVAVSFVLYKDEDAGKIQIQYTPNIRRWISVWDIVQMERESTNG